MAAPGSAWQKVSAQPRRTPGSLSRADFPSRPGVYAWFRDGRPVYAGVAAGSQGLKSRLWTHLDTGLDLSRSAFRRNVLEHLGIATVAMARQRPSALTSAQVAAVNQWIRECELAWIECASDQEAKTLEVALLAEARPPLNRR